MKLSYTAADVDIPIKILHDARLMRGITEDKFILMRHLQLCPTNRCNLNCEYCSCGERDKVLEMPLLDVVNLLDTAKGCGCQAITITGGGEPLLHPDINHIIAACQSRFIKVGLVTNGMELDKLTEHVDWCRISFDSKRNFKPLGRILGRVMKKLKFDPPIDWAFSYVAHAGIGHLKKLVKFAIHYDFTHVRVVSDILNPSDETIVKCKQALRGMDKCVIYQPRTRPMQGKAKCWISLLKPTVAADGNIYPCCGTQYATKSKHDFPLSMGMGKDLKDVVTHQKYFDGSICGVCYYDNYNKLLGLLMEPIKHAAWV